MVGNVDFQRLLEKFKADLSGQGAWLPERGKLVDGRKRDAFEWLVVNGGEQLVRIREDLRTRCNIWMLANGEMEDQLTPRYNKSNYPSLPGKIEAGEATVSEELVSLMKWLVCPVEAAEMQPV